MGFEVCEKKEKRSYELKEQRIGEYRAIPIYSLLPSLTKQSVLLVVVLVGLLLPVL